MSLWRVIKALFSPSPSTPPSEEAAPSSPPPPEAAPSSPPPPSQDLAFIALTRVVAAHFGLRFAATDAPWQDALMQGQRDGHRVFVRLLCASGLTQDNHALEVLIQGSIPHRLALQSRRAVSFEDPIKQGPRRLPPQGVSIGDAPFDEAFNLYSLHPICRAALAKSTCAALVTLAQVAEVRVAQGELLMRQRIFAYLTTEDVIASIQTALSIAHSFSNALWMDDTLPLPQRIPSALRADTRGLTMLEEVARGEDPTLSSIKDRAAALKALLGALPAMRWQALLTSLLTALSSHPQGEDTPYLLTLAINAAHDRPISGILPHLLAIWRSPLCAPYIDILAFKEAALAQPAPPEQVAELTQLLSQKLSADLTGALAIAPTHDAGSLSFTPSEG
jgi:hypothetical protein